jgi:hypothetical protein
MKQPLNGFKMLVLRFDRFNSKQSNQEARWTSEPIWTWRREKLPTFVQDRILLTLQSCRISLAGLGLTAILKKTLKPD